MATYKRTALKLLMLVIIFIITPSLLTAEEKRTERESKKVKLKLNRLYLSRYNEYYNAIPNTEQIEHIYYETQPLQFFVSLEGNKDKSVNIGRDDWFNMIEVFVVTEKEEKVYNKDGTLRDFVKKRSQKRKVNYKVLNKEDIKGKYYNVLGNRHLTDGIINSNEQRYVMIEVYDENNKFFAPGYRYLFSVNLGEYGSGGKAFDIIEAKTHNQKKELLHRRGDKAAGDEDYSLAIKYYKEVEGQLSDEGVEALHFSDKYILFEKISNLYEKTKDYQSAKNYMTKAIKYKDKEYNQYIEWMTKQLDKKGLKLTEEELLEKGKDLGLRMFEDFERSHKEKTKIEQKVKKIDELIKQKEK